MTKWIGRALWLAAWSFWVWLGFGLYRELPRDLGPVVCTIPFERSESIEGHSETPEGFLHGENTIVTWLENDVGPARIRCYNAISGEKTGDFVGPLDRLYFDFSLRHGFVVGMRTRAEGKEPWENITSALNLRTGKWTSLGPGWHVLAYHKSRAWAAAYDPWAKYQLDRGPSRIVVFDLHTGAKIGEWTGQALSQESKDLLRAAYWIEDDELLIVREDVNKSGTATSQRLERWNVHTGAIQPAMSISPRYEWTSEPTADGLMLFAEADDDRDRLSIIDVRAKKQVLESPRTDVWGKSATHGWTVPPRLPASGRTYLSPSGDLWSIVERRIIRRRSSSEMLIGSYEVPTGYLIRESWKAPFGLWDRELRDFTCSLRDFETGEIRFRAWGGHIGLVNTHGTLTVLGDEVRSYPPRVNYPLLALCQTILALPLVLLWVALRWRRNRRLRLASVKP